METGPYEVTDLICDLCHQANAVARCKGCDRALCKKCRSMEIYVQRDGEVVVKNFCPDCIRDPKINPSMGCEKVFGLEDITDMVNQEEKSKSGRFKIKLKMS